eukprot:1138465-Pelagomonas_calceolata.AAC.5
MEILWLKTRVHAAAKRDVYPNCLLSNLSATYRSRHRHHSHHGRFIQGDEITLAVRAAWHTTRALDDSESNVGVLDHSLLYHCIAVLAGLTAACSSFPSAPLFARPACLTALCSSCVPLYVCPSILACRPDRYVPLFGAPPYDIKNEREGDVPFEEQLQGIENVIKQGKVSSAARHGVQHVSGDTTGNAIRKGP